MGYFLGRLRVRKLLFGLFSIVPSILTFDFNCGGGSQRLLILNPTTVLVVLLLGLWLLMGFDNMS